MNRVIVAAAVSVMLVAVVASATIVAGQNKKEIEAVTPDKVRWFTPTFYKDGRQRAQLFGDSSKVAPGSIE